MENDKIAKRAHAGEYTGRPRKRWIDTVKKRGLDVSQARSIWGEFCEREWVGGSPGIEPLTLTRCYCCEIPQPYEALERRKSVCGQANNLRA